MPPNSPYTQAQSSHQQKIHIESNAHTRYYVPGHVMTREDIERWIVTIHGPPEERTLDGANQVGECEWVSAM